VTFDQFSLDPRIQEGVKNAGYITPTPIQEKAIPFVLDGDDILGLAQTGTGKTAAFILPILERLMKGPRGRIRALILAPTRELAEQIYQASLDLGKRTGIRSVSIYGGVSKNPQLAALKRGVEIVVACPGRLLDHLGERSIDLSQIEVLVLDEADRMCDMGFLPDIKRVIKYLPTDRQTLFFSATMPDEIRGLADNILKDPVTVQIGMIAPAETVSHALFPISGDKRKELLFAMLEQTATGRVLIFTRTKHRAKNLHALLLKKNYRAASLQGNLSQNRRQDAINGFRGGKYDILVATDIAARGIDVSEVTHVINFDMPDTVDAYTHRIGRTGRALKTGDAFTLAVNEDAAIVRGIERVLGVQIERRRLPDFDYGGFIPENQFFQRPQTGGGNRQPSPSQSRTHRPGSRGSSRNGPPRGGQSRGRGGRNRRPANQGGNQGQSNGPNRDSRAAR
jgi:ATP-dependent RNA helicase RhlE